MSDVFGVVVPHPPIIVPAVGGARRAPARETIDALGEVAEAVANYAPQTLVVMSPHAPALADAIAVDDSAHLRGALSDFGDETMHVWNGDPALAREIASRLMARGVETAIRTRDARLRAGWLDHGSLVPLSFLDPAHRFDLVILSLSYLPYGRHRAIGAAVAEAAGTLGRRVAFVASGDLSHRLTPDAPAGFSDKAGELDESIVGLVQQGALSELPEIRPDLVEAGGECGLRSFIALGGFAGEDPVPTRVLSYQGPWGVGYLTALVGTAAIEACDTRTITPESGRKGGAPGSDESEIVRLARGAIRSAVTASQRQEPSLSDDYPPRAGAFVSLHIGESLRGCIGTIAPTKDTLAEEVVANAVEAALRDPRFESVRADELEHLDIKVDVLHPPEACRLDDLDPKMYGVITSSGWRRGLLLPDLEGVDDVETQVAIALSKAGIRPGEPCSYERFKVDRYT